MEGLVNDW